LPPIIILNPRDDPGFATEVQRLLADGASTVDALQASLRTGYPKAVVRERGLSHEPAIWYVYRDGHWVSSASQRKG
jgi:hypothetical protein